VVDAATRRTVFRGPPSVSVRSLSFDGRNVAFATAACALVGPAARSASRRTVPRGACLRSDAAVNPESPTILGDRYRVRVACINAPAASCRLTVRLRTRAGKPAGRLRARVPRGGSRVLEVPLNAPGRAERAVTGSRSQWCSVTPTVAPARPFPRRRARRAHAA
jgi:hypothetical protein